LAAMLAFLVRRLVQAVLVMLAVALIAFAMFRFVGDPVNSMLPENASTEDRQHLRAELGLDASVTTQFLRFVTGAAQGEFGISYRNKRPVSDLIAERLPATLELVLVAAIFALLAGVPMGVYTALNRHGVISNLLQVISLIGISVPTFVTGILLILVFSVWLNWLPSFGRGEVVQVGWWSTGFLTLSGLKSLVLPAVMLGLFQVTLIMRLVRAEMLEVLRSDFVRFARARGLTDRAVHFGHALRNTLMPVITIVGLQLGSMIAFAIITETVFQWPGMGLLFIQAVSFADIPVMSAYLILVAFVFVVLNMIVDLLYFAIDPRLSMRGGRA
jgi:peptide/nickel transport system permease protein